MKGPSLFIDLEKMGVLGIAVSRSGLVTDREPGLRSALPTSRTRTARLLFRVLSSHERAGLLRVEASVSVLPGPAFKRKSVARNLRTATFTGNRR